MPKHAAKFNVHLQTPADPQIESVVALLARVLRERAGLELARVPRAKAQLVLGVRPGPGPEGYAISDDGPTRLSIMGHDAVGLRYGVGKFLHDASYAAGAVKPGAWRGTDKPATPLRGMYFAFNFNNWYCSAPREDLGRYAEDLSLWGVNTVLIGAQPVDPDNRAAFTAVKERLGDILRRLKGAGHRVGLLWSPNVDFPNPPPEALATPVPDTDPARRGQAGTRVCPSHPAGLRFLRRQLDALIEGYEDVGIDYLCAFPYDSGGCGCAQCWPWGARGFVDLSKEFAAIGRRRYPNSQFILCTWCYDVRPESDGEFEGLDRELRQDRSWVHYIMADSHEDFPPYILQHGVPGGLPMVTFPEISMWGRYPWGGYGANPLPRRFERLWQQVRHLAAGGFPYSEGIFEDLNKVICASFFWDPVRPAVDIVREYVSYEAAPAVVPAITRAIELMEKSWQRSAWRREDVEVAYQLMQEADRQLPDRARQAWRWRILYLRAVIDFELITHPGQPHSDRCDEAFEELTRIYHAENTGGPDAPPSRRCLARLAAAAAAPPPPGAAPT